MSSSSDKLQIGYDIGGTKIEIALLKNANEILYKKREPTEREKGYAHILSILKKLYDGCLLDQKLNHSDITSIGLALPGTVDPQTQVMLIGNTQILDGKDIRKDLSTTLGISTPITCANDANCFALAECHYGVGKDKPKNMVGVILGTGVGGGIIIDGKIISGRRGSAGEIGHIFLKKKDIHCYCGQYDCVESFLSGTALQQAYLEKTGQQASASIILQNPEFLETYRQDLAHFLGRLTNILDPDYFVLGGGVSKFDGIYPELENLMRQHLFYKKNPPKVYKHTLTDSAGSIGAALLNQF